MLSGLPKDINYLFLPYLSTRELPNLSGTNKDFHNIVIEDKRLKSLKTVNKILQVLSEEKAQLQKKWYVIDIAANFIDRHFDRLNGKFTMMLFVTPFVLYGQRSINRSLQVQVRIANWSEIQNKLKNS